MQRVIKTEKLNREARFVNVEIPNDCVKINIEFLDDADIRQIQVFGKNSINKVFEYKIRQEKVKEEKQIYASGTLYNADRQKSFPFDYLYKKNGNYYRLDYDNKKNAYCYKEEEFLQIKTVNKCCQIKVSNVKQCQDSR